MNREQSQPPALASWLLWHLSPKKNREALAGDLFVDGDWRFGRILVAFGASCR